MLTRFEQALTQLPPALANAVKPLLNESFSGCISQQQLQQLTLKAKLTGSELLISLLPVAAAFARPPISQFHVGAIAKGKSGNIYMGANFELVNNALCHTVHAEQHAISHAWLKGETQIVDIIVTASPCGHCRQFMNELVAGQAINIHLPNQKDAPLSRYLPYAFGPNDLNVKTPLLTPQFNLLDVETTDPFILKVLDQAAQSYAPYSHCYSAVGLQTKNGEIYYGRYAENAAFNPSMMPMQMALTSAIRHHVDFKDITRAVLVSSKNEHISLFDASKDALASVSTVSLEYAT